jgi:hypothetical protein
MISVHRVCQLIPGNININFCCACLAVVLLAAPVHAAGAGQFEGTGCQQQQLTAWQDQL